MLPPASAQPSPDPVAHLLRLCRHALLGTGLDSGGISLVTPSGVRATVCVTDLLGALVEERQFTLGEGPCVDAARGLAPVLVPDLLDPGPGLAGRWPAFTEAASAAGVRAVFSLPLRLGVVLLGTVDLVRRTPGGLDAEQLRALLEACDAMALALLELQAGVSGQHPPGREDGMRLRVHAAAGRVSVQSGVPVGHALLLLRARAWADGRAVGEVADDVLAGSLQLIEQEGA